MTERLTDLMQRATDDLRIPAPPTQRIVERGRVVRRTRRRGAAAVVAAVVLVAGVGVGTTWRGTSEVEPARPDDSGRTVSLSGTGPVLAVGSTVLLDGGDVVTGVDRTVTGLDYTSAGVVVRDDAAGRLTLVAADGTERDLPPLPRDASPSTDPGQPYLAYAEVSGDASEVVVLDVRDGTEVARVAVPDGSSTGEVALDGDVVYVAGAEQTRAVDWRTGAVTAARRVVDVTTVRGGRTVVSQGGTRSVTDIATGELLSLATGTSGSLSLSPDGRYALVGDRVVELDTQSAVRVGLRGPVGWSPSDQPFVVDGDRLTTCSPTTGECTETRLDLPDGPDDGSPVLGGEG
jgi:hypothetical protein